MKYLILLFSFPIMSMMNQDRQLEICLGRKVYLAGIAQHAHNAQQEGRPACVFCDPKVLAANYTISEVEEKDVRVILNKNQYFDRDQGDQFVFMPISHVVDVALLSKEQIENQADVILEISGKLWADSYSQEYVVNDGKGGGRSVDHLHSHLKNHVLPSASLRESLQRRENPTIMTIEQQFVLIQKKLNAQKFIPKAPPVVMENSNSHSDFFGCLCCSIYRNYYEDELNLVIRRFKHNYVCLAHYPTLPGQLSVIPYRHVWAMKDLSQEELRENMVIAIALLPKVKEYAHQFIRDCTGANIYTKSIGGLAPIKKTKYHLCTTVIPRTVISATPGTFEGNSTKIDLDARHYVQWMKQKVEELEIN